jgi:hypothetical protein
MDMSHQLHALADLPTGKEPSIPRVGPRTGLDDVEKKQFLPLMGLEL